MLHLKRSKKLSCQKNVGGGWREITIGFSVAKHTFYWSTTYIQKRAETTVLKEFSRNRHAQVTSNQIKEQNIQGAPLCPLRVTYVTTCKQLCQLSHLTLTELHGADLPPLARLTVSCVCLQEYPFSLLCRASLCEYTITCLSIQHGRVATFQFGVIMNSASMNFLVHFSWWIYIHISFG